MHDKKCGCRKCRFALSMLKNPSFPEHMFWLKDGVDGFSFKRQVVLYGYIADFYCKRLKIAVELDGAHHEAEVDAMRDEHLRERGIMTLRFPAQMAVSKPSLCLKEIREAISRCPRRKYFN